MRRSVVCDSLSPSCQWEAFALWWGGAVSGNALLMVLGAIAAVCGLGLGVLAYLAHRKA